MEDNRGSVERVQQEQNIEVTQSQAVLQKRYVGTLKIGSTTPSVKNIENWDTKNTSAVTIENFLEGQDGQTLVIRGDGFTTVEFNANLIPNSFSDKLLDVDLLYFFQKRDGVWYELADIVGTGGGGGGAPTTAQYVVAVADAGLSAERVGTNTAQIEWDFATAAQAKLNLSAGVTAQLTDARTPLAHKTSHENGGSDELNLVGLNGLLADPQTPIAHKTSHENGGSDEINVGGLSGLLADPQTPDLAAHLAAGDPHPQYSLDSDLTTHIAAADPHTVYQKESEKGTASGYASLDAGTKVPQAELGTGGTGGTTRFLREDRAWSVPAGGGGSVTLTEVEVDFGVIPIKEYLLDVVDASVIAGQKIIIQPSYDAATGRNADENEFANFTAIAGQPTAGVGFKMLLRTVNGQRELQGKFKLNYLLG